MYRVITLALALFALPSLLGAQTNPAVVKHRNDCRLAKQVLETGHPAPHRDWALQRIDGCDPNLAGEALASAMRRLRTSSDHVVLAQLARRARPIHDASFFAAALEIAGDRGASIPARVAAFRALMWFQEPNRVLTDSEFYVSFDVDDLQVAINRCQFNRVLHSEPREGSPLPADFREQINTLASRVFNDRSEPVLVRAAALCS